MATSITLKMDGSANVRRQIMSIVNAVQGESAVRIAKRSGIAVLGEMNDRAHAQNVPHEVISDLIIFPYRQGPNKNLITVNVGVRKKSLALGFVEWTAAMQHGKFPKMSRVVPGKSLAPIGRTIGEYLGTMWELGTTKMAARPWFRPAIMASAQKINQTSAEDWSRLISDSIK